MVELKEPSMSSITPCTQQCHLIPLLKLFLTHAYLLVCSPTAPVEREQRTGKDILRCSGRCTFGPGVSLKSTVMGQLLSLSYSLPCTFTCTSVLMHNLMVYFNFEYTCMHVHAHVYHSRNILHIIIIHTCIFYTYMHTLYIIRSSIIGCHHHVCCKLY